MLKLMDLYGSDVQGLGAALSHADLQAIAAALEDFTVRFLLPDLELRLRALNQQVSLPHTPVWVSMPQQQCTSLAFFSDLQYWSHRPLRGCL